MTENVLIALFDIESEAYQAVTELKSVAVTEDYIISQLALVTKKDGKITPADGFDTGIQTSNDTAGGALVGGLIGILGGPLGMLLGASYGALIGGTIDTGDALQNASMLEQVTGKLGDDSVAIIALVQEENESVLDAKLSKFQITIVREDAAIVAEEVEEARQVERELQRQAREKLRAERKENREQKIQERRSKLQADFAALKDKFKPHE